jgi:serine/threonine protein kinase
MRYNSRASRLELSPETEKNFFRINGDEFLLETLDAPTTKGGNSSVFRAQHPDGDQAYIVKFFRHLRENKLPINQRRLQRFEREIQALKLVFDSPHRECVIPIVDHGIYPLRGKEGAGTLRYYVMEEADMDLAQYLQKNELSPQQKILLCNDLLLMLQALHRLDIYHRDIKPNNILMIESSPVFGDLGLINFRNPDSDLDHFDEKVGPFGFLSPEATNKCLGSREKPSFDFDCWIDEKSDIFQLGQVFWLILQDEVPTGHLTDQDFKFPVRRVLDTVIQPMLQYGKQRRASVEMIGTALKPIMDELALTYTNEMVVISTSLRAGAPQRQYVRRNDSKIGSTAGYCTNRV